MKSQSRSTYMKWIYCMLMFEMNRRIIHWCKMRKITFVCECCDMWVMLHWALVTSCMYKNRIRIRHASISRIVPCKYLNPKYEDHYILQCVTCLYKYERVNIKYLETFDNRHAFNTNVLKGISGMCGIGRGWDKIKATIRGLKAVDHLKKLTNRW